MPRTDIGQDPRTGQDTAPTLPTGSEPLPLPKPGDPGFMGPAAPQPSGLRGQARFDEEVSRMQLVFSGDKESFYKWLLTQKDDPTDQEYTLALRNLKNKLIRERQGPLPFAWSVADTREALQAGAPGQPPTYEQKSGGVDPLRPGASSFSASGDERKPVIEVPESGRPGSVAEAQRRRMEGELYTKEDILASKQDVFKGRKLSDEEIYAAEGQQDPYLSQFLENEGITLTGDSRNIKLKSGEYVYMGRETDAEYGTQHDVYMYVQDAEFALVDLGPDQIAAYQKALGAPVTGKTDPDLQKIWNYAVNQARGYAARGQKVTVKELMDIYVAQTAAQNAGRGGGGGGGGRFAGETPEEIVAIDYYRGMMAILGDISGVPDAKA